jgi:hypothetical protein
VISLGFAGLLGEQIRQLRSRISRHQLAAALALFGLALLPPLSLPPVIQWIGWVTASLVIVLFALQPKVLPACLFTRSFAWRYASFAMLLAALWNILAGPGLPNLALSLLALFASLLCWKRGQDNAG